MPSYQTANGPGQGDPEQAIDSNTASIDTGEKPENIKPPEPDMHPLLTRATGPDVLVDFDGKNDTYNPLNWTFRKKAISTLLYGLTTCWITFSSAVLSAGTQEIMDEFGVSSEVAALGTSLMVFAFGIGPLFWAPLSEVYGRRWVILLPYFVAAAFTFGTATSKDIQTVLITRFFAGLFGSAPVANTGGVMVDIWLPHQRGTAMVCYALTLAVGPALAPLVGGAITSSYLGWRWTQYLTGIVMVAQFLIDVVVLRESYAPVLLVFKAQRLRFKGGNWALHAKHEELDINSKELYQKYLIRPFQMLGTPICLLISIYSSFVYGILYANLESVTVAYQEVRGWGPVVGALPFVALLIGIIMGSGVNIYNNKYWMKKFIANGYKSVPEARLPSMILGGFAFAAGMFLFGWTSSKHISPWPSIVGVALIGFGFTTIFQSALNYLVDTFTRYSASALAANTFLRSVFAGAFPIFVLPMFQKLGVDWGSTVFACIASAMIPVPFLFFAWGKKIRARGEWSRLSV